jgi:signal transduction histidine kinase/CHASE2 domain-containing sensor protein
MIRNRSQAARTALVIIFSIALVPVVTWFAPSLSAASLNMLFRLRGELTAPDDLVILAIDDLSLQRIGKWPWPRSVMADVLDKLTQARVRSVGLDIIYAEPSAPEEDKRLAATIARNGRVILPAQLYETTAKENPAQLTTAWLLPLPEFVNAAKSIGHAHVSPGVDGVARSLQLSKADDRADRLWALGFETVRVAEQIPAAGLKEEAGSVRLGGYRIPVLGETDNSTIPGVDIVRQNEMLINFAGPARSFKAYSIADLLDGKVQLSTLADKIVLIGAVAESMGDSRVAPFMHYRADRRQGGQEMPGVEIHANIINTIRGRLSFRALPDWADYLAAFIVILCSALTIKFLDGWGQIMTLGFILLTIIFGSFFAFSQYLIIPPFVPMMTGFVAIIPLLLNRALTTSHELDVKLAALISSQKGFPSPDLQAKAEFADRELGLDLPQSLAWKLRAVDDLTAQLLARMNFINRILSSMGEGVIVADLAGQIVFANRQAMQLFRCGQAEMIGASFVDLLTSRGSIDETKWREAVTAAAAGPQPPLDFELSSTEPRYYSVMLSALGAGLDASAKPVASANAARNILSVGEAIGVVALVSDVTKRVELDRMKTETLQLVSHELRTPLTSIQGLSDVLLKFPVGADEARDMHSTIHSEAVRLSETINRYLDLTRLESGAQPLRLTSVSCQKVVADCIRNHSLLAAERKITLNSQIDPVLPPIQADAQLLAQALNNLVSNAIKYSPPETEITITAAPDEEGFTISVRDQGFGIPAAVRERIFEKFYRLERDAVSGIVGTGLGLPLVKEIVERHGGRITVGSAPLVGSVFTIHLPPQMPSLVTAT